MRFSLQNYRHVVVGIAREHVKPLATGFQLHQDARGKADLGMVLAWQTCHRAQQGASTYGLDRAFPSSLQPELLHAYRDVSTIWHRWLGLDTFSSSADPRWRARIGLPDVQEQPSEPAEPSPPSQRSPLKRKRPNQEVDLPSYESDSDDLNPIPTRRQRRQSPETEVVLATSPTLMREDVTWMGEDSWDDGSTQPTTIVGDHDDPTVSPCYTEFTTLKKQHRSTAPQDIEGEPIVVEDQDADATSQDQAEEAILETETEAERFQVQRIIGRRVLRGRHVQYHIEWEDYPDPADYTWEPAHVLHEDVPEMVAAFERAWKVKSVGG